MWIPVQRSPLSHGYPCTWAGLGIWPAPLPHQSAVADLDSNLRMGGQAAHSIHLWQQEESLCKRKVM